MFNPLSFITGNPLYMAIAAAVIFAAGSAAGWQVRAWKANSDQNAVARGYIVAMKQSVDRERRTAAAIQADLDLAREQRETDRRKFDDDLDRVKNSQLVRCPPARRPAQTSAPKTETRPILGEVGSVDELYRTSPEPVEDADPGVEFQPAFIRLWNDALGTGATAAERASRPDERTEGAGVVDAKRVLRNLRENTERWSECRAQVRGWIKTARENGWAK